MEVKIEKIDEKTLIKIEGRIDTANSPDFDAAVAPILKDNVLDIIIDCSELTYISSSGLRGFLTIQKSVNAKGGNLVIKNMSDNIKSIFDMIGFSKLFKFE